MEHPTSKIINSLRTLYNIGTDTKTLVSPTLIFKNSSVLSLHKTYLGWRPDYSIYSR